MLIAAPMQPRDGQPGADLTLRGWSGRLRARVTWPSTGPASGRSPLLLWFPDSQGASGLGRAVGRAVGAVVMEIALRPAPREPTPTAFHDAVAALEWAADHGAELDADPGCLLVGGERTGAAVAGAMALHARDNWWPAVERQLLVRPLLDAWHPSVPYVSSLASVLVAGVAPATVVTGGSEGGRHYAARLRGAGVAVDELAGETELLRAVRRA